MARGGNPSLPLDIIINILKRLRVKILIRFQCVCKEWKNLFKTPSFIAEHSHHPDHKNPSLLLRGHNFGVHKPSSLCLLNHKMDTLAVLSVPFGRNWKIIGSCNGLLCVEVFRDRVKIPDFGRVSGSLWLWNPVTREVRKVPDTLNDHSYVCSVGFGFSSVANDYNIVRFYNQNLDRRKEDQYLRFIKHDRVEVFSLSTGSWKVLESEALQCTEVFGPAFSSDGTIFWYGYQQPFSTLVILFDMAKEVFTLTPKPRDISFGVYQNKLVGHVLIKEGPGSHSILVLMCRKGASESGKSSICTQEYRIGPISDVLRPVCIWGDEVVCRDDKEDEVEGDPDRVLHMFNFITNEQRKFNYSIDCDWIGVYNYEESLASVWNTQEERTGESGSVAAQLRIILGNLIQQL
ncbi:hypothetical protein K1719_001881 [Acacia pycnantha]|nr:hypothetical protein K1719_001881 [Acacia pycnantha]